MQAHEKDCFWKVLLKVALDRKLLIWMRQLKKQNAMCILCFVRYRHWCSWKLCGRRDNWVSH